MSDTLSAKQKLFCQGVAAGLTQYQAYIDAGYSEKGADESASRLLRNAKIREYVEELQQPAEDAIRLTAEKVHKRLYEIAIECPEGFTGADSIRAMAEYNKMVGGYEPDKIEINPLQKILDDIRKGK